MEKKTTKEKIKTFFQENSWVKYLLLILLCLVGLWWLSTGSFWTGKQKEPIKAPLVTTPSSSAPTNANCVSCKDYDKKVMEEAQKISNEEIVYLKRVEKLSGEKIFGKETKTIIHQKTRIVYVEKKSSGCRVENQPKPTSQTSGGRQYGMDIPASQKDLYEGTWRIWNPKNGRATFQAFEMTKSGVEAGKAYCKAMGFDLHGDEPPASMLH